MPPSLRDPLFFSHNKVRFFINFMSWNLGDVHTKPGKSEKGVWLWKCFKCFPSTLRRRKLKTQQSPVILVLCRGKLGQGNHVIIVRPACSKSSVFKIASFRLDYEYEIEYASDFSILGFTLSRHISTSFHEAPALPKTNMKNKGFGNLTGLKCENRTRTQSRTRSPI